MMNQAGGAEMAKKETFESHLRFAEDQPINGASNGTEWREEAENSSNGDMCSPEDVFCTHEQEMMVRREERGRRLSARSHRNGDFRGRSGGLGRQKAGSTERPPVRGSVKLGEAHNLFSPTGLESTSLHPSPTPLPPLSPFLLQPSISSWLVFAPTPTRAAGPSEPALDVAALSSGFSCSCLFSWIVSVSILYSVPLFSLFTWLSTSLLPFCPSRQTWSRTLTAGRPSAASGNVSKHVLSSLPYRLLRVHASVFTRCKDSLQDGPRLENISWRLWYREVSQYRLSHPHPDGTPSCTMPTNAAPLSPTSDDGAAFRGSPSPQLTKSSLRHIESPAHLNGHLDVATSDNDHLSISSTSSMRPSPKRTKSNSSVGQIICDMIPDKLVVSTAKRSPSVGDKVAPVNASTLEPCIVVAPVPSTLLPAMRLPPSTPPSGSSLFPRVVVVNPTPHPTPPATPVPAANTHPTMPSGQTHLILPAVPSGRPAPRPDWSAVGQRAGRVFSRVTCHPSDRRFFLQQDESPSPERDSHSQGSTGRTPSDAGDLEPSSAASNQTRESTLSKSPATHASTSVPTHEPCSAAAPGNRASLQGARVVQCRFTVVQWLQSYLLWRSFEAARSPSEAGSSHRPSSTQKEAPTRKLVLANSDSEYETDTDDDSWIEEGSEEDEEQLKAKKEEIRLREAALEAQRQRDMFAKVPKRSYSNLNRTQSGLLSALLNPDPSVLPHGAPYRSISSHDISRLPRTSALTAQLSMSKSSAALPTMAQVTAQVPKTNGATAAPDTQRGYRPKAQPQGSEVEYDSDSGDENPDDTIQLSNSLAHQKLAALADPNRRRNSDRGPPTEPQVRPVLLTARRADTSQPPMEPPATCRAFNTSHDSSPDAIDRTQREFATEPALGAPGQQNEPHWQSQTAEHTARERTATTHLHYDCGGHHKAGDRGPK
ncbi:hypothetical protein EVG20_g2055 [Dentipellis fragilis]|uniref:Nitrogen regulatory protein areA GATA-like domain-containing protein n=1 Tax=Dentipellis fragilis TaxID=205917 RepID=A0A4Y9ZAW8_9AGAM|nr:hypothetical protein EVG20_g2055 [Dentipellis fragilis]